MKNLKQLRTKKSYFAIMMAILTLIVSCEKYNLTSEKNIINFRYDMFNGYEGQLLQFKKTNESKKESSLIVNQKALDQINYELGTDLEFDPEFKALNPTNKADVINWGLKNKIIDNTDVKILNNFITEGKLNGIESALEKLESNVFNSNINYIKLKKYETLANVVKFINIEDPTFFSNPNSNYSKLVMTSCFWAIVGIIFAFIALILACPATVPTGGATATPCYFAALNFVRASIVLGNECGN